MKKPSLNHIFRLVWNDALGVYVPVAEHASARRKRNASGAVALTAALLLSGPALAADLPTGGNVVAGSGSISQNGGAMTINQQTGKMAVDWQSFSIGKGNSVTFKQPGRDSVALNRVLGPDVSVIQGALNANGQVFLVNPNGVVFTPTAQVNVGGIVASTLNISTQDFLAGNYKFEGASSNAIINQGNITAAPGGSIALIAAKITNTGNLTADKGNVLLGAGSRVRLDLGGPIKIEVEQGAIDALIEQGGAIRADGGTVYLTAKAAGDLASTVINHTGITQAKSLATGENGKIVLLGDMVNDRIAVSGTLDASAPNGGRGGFIETSAANVRVAAGALVTTKAASGQHGSWLIDPTDFTVSAGAGASSDSGIGADTLSANLNNGSVELRTVDNGSEAGNINVNSAVTWSASTKLTLSAHGDVNINAPITATGASAGLEINVGGFKQRGYSSGGNYAANAPVTLSGAQSTFNKNGQNYTMLRTVQDLQSVGRLGYGFYALANDLDLTGMIFTGAVAGNLKGSFAGLGHTVDNLTINGGTYGVMGLFGNIDSSGDVRDLTIRNANITGGGFLGPLAGMNSGTVRNVSASGSVTGGNSLGGLIGTNDGTISYSNARTTVTSTTKGYFLGGLTGSNAGVIDNAYAKGNVIGGNSDQGGLAGSNSGVIRNAYATGDVLAAADGSGTAIGGLVGSARSDSVISNVFASGKVTGNGHTGGIVGLFSGSNITLENAHWDTVSTGQANATPVTSGGTITATTGISSAAYTHTSYANLGTWSSVPGTNNMFVAKDADGNAKWIMFDGITRPFLASEYSLAVSNDHQLQLMAYNLNAQYNLVRDVDAKATQVGGGNMWNGNGFASIGLNNEFTGSLNGNGHIISDLKVGSYGGVVGLFGFIGATGVVQNLGLNKITVSGLSQMGGLAGVNRGKIDNVYADVNVSTNMPISNGIGGLVGANYGSISNSYTTGTVGNNTPLMSVSGGLVGVNLGTIDKSYSTARNTSAFQAQFYGALVGQNGGTVTASFAASTDAQGLPVSVSPLAMIFSNGGTVDSLSGLKTYQELTQLSTFTNAGWDIDTVGGTGSVWRMYEGSATPLLRSLLKQVTVSLADKVYDGQLSGGASYVSSNPNAVLNGSIGYITNSKNAGLYTVADGSLTVSGGLSSNQLGYDIIYADGLSLNVLKKGVALDFTADDKTYDGTTNAVVSGTVGSGLVSGDSLSASGSGSFGDKNAGASKSVRLDSYALTGDDAGNYFVASTSAGNLTATIHAKTLTGSATGSDKVYDGQTGAGISASYAGSISGDSLALVGNFADKNVGQGKLITIGLIGADAGNYVLGSGLTSTTGSITARNLNATATAGDKIYDGTRNVQVNASVVSGLVQGDDVQVLGSGLFSDKNVGQGKQVATQGSLQGEDAGNYVLSINNTASASITPKAITGAITAAGKTYDGTRDAVTSGQLSGVILGDAVSLASAGQFGDKNVGTNKNVAVSGSLAGTDAGNYTLASTNLNATASITPKALTGAITAAGKTYDGTASAVTTGTLTGAIAGDTVALSTAGTFANKNAGVGKLVNVSGVLTGTDAGNYTVSSNTTTTATITVRQLTGALGALDKVYDGGNLASVTGANSLNVVAGDSLNVSGSFSDKNVANGKTVNYVLGGTDAGNYALGNAVTLGTASITPLTISGAITAAGKVYDGLANADTTGGLTGVLLGDRVTLATSGAFSDKNVGNGKTVNVSGSLGGADAGNYVLAANATTTASITPKAITGALTAASKVYDGSFVAATTGVLNGVVAGDNVVVNGSGQFGDKNVGIGKLVAVNGVLAGADAGNYLLTTNLTTHADITPKALTGAITAAGKTYDGATAADTSGSLAGLIAGDTVAFATSGQFADKNAGTGKQVNVSGSLTGADAGNYTVTSNATTTADIAKRVLGVDGTVVAGKTYDGSTAAQASAGALTNLVNGESLSVTTTAQFDNANAGTQNANVRYTLADGDAGLAANYVLADTQHQAVIDRRAITVAADDKTKRAGDADPALTWRVTQGNLVGNDTLAGVLSRAAGENAGNYAISANGLANSNYLVAAQDGTLVIDNAVQPDGRRQAAQSAAQWLQAAVGNANANATPPNLTGDLTYVPVNSNGQGQGGETQPAPNTGSGARVVQGPAQVLVIDGGIRLPEGVVAGGI